MIGKLKSSDPIQQFKMNVDTDILNKPLQFKRKLIKGYCEYKIDGKEVNKTDKICVKDKKGKYKVSNIHILGMFDDIDESVFRDYYYLDRKKEDKNYLLWDKYNTYQIARYNVLKDHPIKNGKKMPKNILNAIEDIQGVNKKCGSFRERQNKVMCVSFIADPKKKIITKKILNTKTGKMQFKEENIITKFNNDFMSKEFINKNIPNQKISINAVFYDVIKKKSIFGGFLSEFGG